MNMNSKMRQTPQPPLEPTATRESSRTSKGSAAASLPSRPPPKELNKSEKVLSLLNQADGATLGDLVDATGGLPHTARAALTGLKKKGHNIQPTKVDGGSRYVLVGSSVQ